MDTKKEVIRELKVAKGKIELASYHSGQQVDLSWLDHRISDLEGEIMDDHTLRHMGISREEWDKVKGDSMAKYNLVITEDDKNNLVSILDTCTIKGADALYIVGLRKRIADAECIEEDTPPPDAPVDPEVPSEA